jgi:hypothetical protein
MCFGKSSSGPSAEEIYQSKKKADKPLPSLGLDKTDRPDQKLEDVPQMRKGMQRRTLLGGY